MAAAAKTETANTGWQVTVAAHVGERDVQQRAAVATAAGREDEPTDVAPTRRRARGQSELEWRRQATAPCPHRRDQTRRLLVDVEVRGRAHPLPVVDDDLPCSRHEVG